MQGRKRHAPWKNQAAERRDRRAVGNGYGDMPRTAASWRPRTRGRTNRRAEHSIGAAIGEAKAVVRECEIRRRRLTSANITRPQTPVTAAAQPRNRDRRDGGGKTLSVAVVCNVTGGRREMADETARSTAASGRRLPAAAVEPRQAQMSSDAAQLTVQLRSAWDTGRWSGPRQPSVGRLVRGCVAASRRRRIPSPEWRQ